MNGPVRIILLLALMQFRFIEGNAQPGNSLTVVITDLHNSNGYVLVSLYSQAEGFPSESAKAFKKEKVSINAGSAIASFHNIPMGNFAIAILHDENNNLKMDTHLFGIPKEGYGFSNNARAVFGPPSFKKASFTFNPLQTVKISIRY